MIMTFDWLLAARGHQEWKKEIEKTLLCDKPQVLFYDDMFKLSFEPSEQMVTVRPFSEDSMFHWKIVPKRFSYKFVRDFLEGSPDILSGEGIFDVDEVDISPKH